MRKITFADGFSQLRGWGAVVLAFVLALDPSLHGSTLIVSDWNGGNNGPGSSQFFNTAPGNASGTWVGQTPTGAGGEGGVCLAGSNSEEIFTADAGPNIDDYNLGNQTLTTAYKGPPGTIFASMSFKPPTTAPGVPTGPVLFAADTGNGLIYEFDASTPGTLSLIATASFPHVHDVVWDTNNMTLYATAPGAGMVVAYHYSGGALVPKGAAYNITLPAGVTSYAGLAVDAYGNLFVSNFATGQPGVYEYVADGSGSFNSTFISFVSAQFDRPLGLTAGPPGDAHIYVANFGTVDDSPSDGVLRIDPTGLNPGDTSTAVAGVSLSGSPSTEGGPSGSAGRNPKYVQFLENCTSKGSGYIEICKASSTINPVPATGVYSFSVTGAASPVSVAVGECSAPIQVAAGTPTITEVPTPGVGVSDITAVGYSPPPFSQYEPDLVVGTADLQTGTATVAVPASATGDTSLETIVTYTNYEAPPAGLKICKIAGGSNVTGTFNFTTLNIISSGSGYTSAPSVVFSGGGCSNEPAATTTIAGGMVNGIALTSAGSGCTTAPTVTIAPPSGPNGTPAMASATIVSVEAGPLGEGGYCQVVPGAFKVGTSGTVTEAVPSGGYLPPSPITVNGVNTAPNAGCGPGINSLSGFLCTVVAEIGPGTNEVSFTDNLVSTQSGGGGSLPTLEIVNYSLVRTMAAKGTKSYMTYRADLLNVGTTNVGPITAAAKSLDPSTIQVVGQATLSFAPAPANSQVASTNTFTILADPNLSPDFSKLKWNIQSSRSIRPELGR